jgi:hypothetical protein
VVQVQTLLSQQLRHLVEPVVVLHVQQPVQTLLKQLHLQLQMVVLVELVEHPVVVAVVAIQPLRQLQQLLAVMELRTLIQDQLSHMVLVAQVEQHAVLVRILLEQLAVQTQATAAAELLLRVLVAK